MSDELVSRRAFVSRTAGACLPMAVGIACSRASQPTRPAEATRLDSFTAWLAERVPGLLKAQHVPGLSVALIRDGAIAWQRAHLSRGGLTTMVTPVSALPPGDGPSSSWALGWQVFATADGPVIAHGGNGKGFHAFAGASVGAQSGFVAMTNGDNGWRVLGELGLGKDMRGWLGFA